MIRYQHTPTEVRIRRAIGAMPYGGLQSIQSLSRMVGLSPHGTPEQITLESVAAYLEALGSVLSGVVADITRDGRELDRLRSDVAAVRRLLGIGGDK